MAASHPPFRSLRTSSTPPVPLYITATFTENSYTVYVTDFVRLWTESLKKGGIYGRSEEQDNTEFDPSEDTSNLRLLLKTLEKEVLDSNGRNVQLVRDEDQPRYLFIRTTSRLPGVSSPLKWQFVLKPASLETFSNIIVKPFVKLAAVYRDKIEELRKVVKAKEGLIDSLTEQLEGTDYKNVLSARRRKALEPYQDGTWNEGSIAEGIDAGKEWEAVNRAASDDGNSGEWWFKLRNVNPSDDWQPPTQGSSTYAHAEKASFDGDAPRGGRAGNAHRRSSVLASRKETDEERDPDDIFVRLKTPTPPPNPKRGASTKTADNKDHESFSDTEEDGPAPRQGKLTDKVPPRPKPVDHMDLDDTATESEEEEYKAPSRGNREIVFSNTVSPKAKPVTTELSNTEDDDDDLDAPVLASQSTTTLKGKSKSPSPISSKPGSKGKLGGVGRKRKESTPQPTPYSPPRTRHSLSPPSVSQPAGKRKLGALGGKKGNVDSDWTADNDEPTATSEATPKKVVGGKFGGIGGGVAKRRREDEPTADSKGKTLENNSEFLVPEKTKEELEEEEADRRRQELEEELAKQREKMAKKGKKRKF